MIEQAPERLLTAPLVVFIVLVLGVVTAAIASRSPRPDLDGAIALLADGDLDQHERQPMLLHVTELAKHSESLRHRWAGALAAVAMRDRVRFDALEVRLGTGADRVLPAEQCEWLSLGDAVILNVRLAMMSEASGDKGLALTKWG